VEPHTVSHDVERSARLFDETNIEPGATRDVRAPTQPGEYAFKCAYHPEMTGYLVVQAPDAATPTPPTDPTGGSPAGTPSPTEQIPTPGPPLMLATLVGAALVARASRR
jgi:hypothetical protein